jgi:N-acetylglutamate synthase-like GNAT family acetyltransferase
VRHARAPALDELEPLLQQLRHQPGLVERSRGVFYRASRAFLHFHEDPSGLHADVRLGDDFERVRVETDDERTVLLTRVRAVLGDDG